MEPMMSCPQGLTLSGKMCTVAPTLSCPTGYTLVNGMCQEDDGLQGFGDSMNIPPSAANPIGAGEFGDQTPQQPQTQTQTQTPTPTMFPPPVGNIVSDVGGMVAQKLSAGVQQELMPGMMGQQSPMMKLPSQQQPPSGLPSRASSYSPRVITTTNMSPAPPPPTRSLSPPKRSQSPGGIRPSPSSSSSSPPQLPSCPTGYSLNKLDMMCYPI